MSSRLTVYLSDAAYEEVQRRVDAEGGGSMSKWIAGAVERALADVAIVDRDWNGKEITNPVIYATGGSVVASDTVLASLPISYAGGHAAHATYTIPRGWRGAVRAKLSFHTSLTPGAGTGSVRLNGAGVYSYYIGTENTSHSGTVDLPAVSEGDVIEIRMDGGTLDAATICGTTSTTTRQIGGTPASW